MLKLLQALFGRPRNPLLVVEGYHLPPVKSSHRQFTPCGSRITVVEFCANIYYTIDDAGIPTIHRVELWQPAATATGPFATCNAFATHTGEAFRVLKLEPDDVLKYAAEQELATPNSGLQRIIVARWRDANRGNFGQAIADILNNHEAYEQLTQRIDEAWGEREITFWYEKRDGIGRQRKVKVSSASETLLRGTDLEDGTFKTFLIERISKAQPL